MKRATFAQASATTGFLVFCWQRSAILYTDVAFVSVERTRLSANGRTLQEAVDRDRAIKAVCRRSTGRISTHRHWTEGRGTSRPLYEPLVDRHRLGLIDDRLLAVTVSWLCNTWPVYSLIGLLALYCTLSQASMTRPNTHHRRWCNDVGCPPISLNPEKYVVWVMQLFCGKITLRRPHLQWLF